MGKRIHFTVGVLVPRGETMWQIICAAVGGLRLVSAADLSGHLSGDLSGVRWQHIKPITRQVWHEVPRTVE